MFSICLRKTQQGAEPWRLLRALGGSGRPKAKWLQLSVECNNPLEKHGLGCLVVQFWDGNCSAEGIIDWAHRCSPSSSSRECSAPLLSLVQSSSSPRTEQEIPSLCRTHCTHLRVINQLISGTELLFVGSGRSHCTACLWCTAD